eukprot:2929015-Rhodomonas_salina.1
MSDTELASGAGTRGESRRAGSHAGERMWFLCLICSYAGATRCPVLRHGVPYSLCYVRYWLRLCPYALITQSLVPMQAVSLPGECEGAEMERGDAA